MSVSTGDLVVQIFTTANPTTGAAADADSLPTGVLWIDGVANGATVTIADATGTGRYTFSVTMPTLTTGQRVAVVVAATIATIACAGEVWADQCSPAVNVTYLAGQSDPVDNLVLALGNSSGVMISNAAVDAVWDEAGSGHLTAGTMGAKLNAAAAGSGSGSTTYTDTVTDVSSNPLDGVEVWITSDSGGASTVASTTTNTLGAFTVYLDPGTYYLWLAKGGYNFPNPTTITVT